MAKRPAFMFYPADWRNNANLRRCSAAARGAWMDTLCLLHDSDEYGVLRWPLGDIAQAAGVAIRQLRELADKGVLKGGDDRVAAYVYAPRHAGKDGEPVVLIPEGEGPCWYCSRMVKDEWVRERRGSGSRFSDTNQPPKPTPKTGPKGGIGGRQGDGPSFALAVAVTEELSVANATGASPPADPIWGTGLAFLQRKGVPEKQARSLLGKIKQAAGDVGAAALLSQAETEDITDPAPWLLAAAAKRGRGGRPAPGLLPREARSEDELAAENEASYQRMLGGVSA